jgi:hypothetical protein
MRFKKGLRVMKEWGRRGERLGFSVLSFAVLNCPDSDSIVYNMPHGWERGAEGGLLSLKMGRGGPKILAGVRHFLLVMW